MPSISTAQHLVTPAHPLPLLPPYLPQQSFAPVVHNSSGSFAWRPERPAAADFVAQKWAWSGFTPGGALTCMHQSARFWCQPVCGSASLRVRAQLSWPGQARLQAGGNSELYAHRHS